MKIPFAQLAGLAFAPVFACAAGLPEPGFIIYGAISNVSNDSIGPDAVVWHVSSSSSAVSVTAASINVNGQYFYVATVPFETRSVGGVPAGAPTANTLPLDTTSTTFARLATVNATNATIVYASSGIGNTFTFGPEDRGRIERVDLSVSATPTFTQWLTQYGLPANSNPNSDPTHKGMTLMQQYIAGLNPDDPNSVFAFIGIQAIQQDVQVQWASAAGVLYTLQQGGSLSGPFGVLQSNIVATPGTNVFTIPIPVNGANLFFRIAVQQPN